MYYRPITLFIRTLFKNRVISSINLSGLVLGIFSTLLIVEYVFFERSFEGYNPVSTDVYRIAYNRYNNDGILYETANYFSPSGPYLKQTFPEVLNYVTMRRLFDITISYNKGNGNILSFNETKTYYTTPSVFDVFAIKLLTGNKDKLNEPYTVALSERSAKKMFGNENPIGKVISVNNKESYTVIGVYKNIPSNTHFKTDFIFSYQTRVVTQKGPIPNWRHDLYYNYIQLKPGTDYHKFAQVALHRMVQENYSKQLKDYGWRDEVFLQPVKDIHLQSKLEYETEPGGNSTIISLLFGFALFFLLVAWINYINLVTSQSLDRAKEVGIKKANGCTRKSLVFQFMGESLLFNLLAFVVALVLFLIVNPYFRHWAGIYDIQASLYFKLAGFTFIVFIIGVILSGFYPAFVLSSFNPSHVLKGKFSGSAGNIKFRKVLVSVQFIVSLVFLSGTLISIKQVDYLFSMDTGLNYHSKIAILLPRVITSQEEYLNNSAIFRNKLIQTPGIKKLTLTSDIPGQDMSIFFNCYRKGLAATNVEDFYRTDIDTSFQKFFKAKLLYGRFFRTSDNEELNNLILNVSATKRLGYAKPSDAVNQIVIGKNKEWNIIGVLADFNFMTLKTVPVPTIFSMTAKGKRYVCLEFGNPEKSDLLLKKVQNLYSQVYPGAPFEFHYIDDVVGSELKTDKTVASEFSLFAILAIIISVIGMLGLIIITVNRNIKEMGVRKVLGATRGNIALLLTRLFIWELIISVIIAVPFSIIGFQRWFLNKYVYAIELNGWYFIIPILVLCTLLTVIILFMSNRVWKLNPTEALRYE
jgi:putative ABC transport system permease protein